MPDGCAKLQEAKQVRHPSTALDFEWDDANGDKLAERGILIHEVEGLWGNNPRFTRNKKAGSATWWMIGTDPVSGKKLKVGVLWAVEEDRILRAITALDLSPTKKK
jgi:hypothetical protein